MNMFVKHSELQEQDQKRRAENIHFSILKYKRVLRALLNLVLQARDTEEASEAARSPRERVQAVAEGLGKRPGRWRGLSLAGQMYRPIAGCKISALRAGDAELRFESVDGPMAKWPSRRLVPITTENGGQDVRVKKPSVRVVYTPTTL